MEEASAITGGSTSSAYDDGRGPDPEAWVFEPQWEDQRGVYSNWQNWTSWDVKGEDTENLEEEAVEGAGGGQDGDEEEEDDEEVDQEDDGFLDENNFPPWAVKSNVKAHEANNNRRGGERGSYCIKGGRPCFQANDQYGGMTFEAGLGRKKARTRGKNSVIKQKGKKKAEKGKDTKGKGLFHGKGKNKGKGNGKGKGGSTETADHALSVVESALVGQNKLIDLLCSKESKEPAAKIEPKDDPHWERGNWSGHGGSSGSSSWSW